MYCLPSEVRSTPPAPMKVPIGAVYWQITHTWKYHKCTILVTSVATCWQKNDIPQQEIGSKAPPGCQLLPRWVFCNQEQALLQPNNTSKPSDIMKTLKPPLPLQIKTITLGKIYSPGKLAVTSPTVTLHTARNQLEMSFCCCWLTKLLMISVVSLFIKSQWNQMCLCSGSIWF